MRPLVPLLLLALAAAPARAQSQTPAPPPADQGVAAPTVPEWARQAIPDGAEQALPRMSMPQAPRIATEDAQGLLEAGEIVFLDVREPKELEELGTLRGYVNIPLAQLEKRLDELPKDKAIVTACTTGGRAARAAAFLESRGYAVIAFCTMLDYKGKGRVFPRAIQAGGVTRD